MKTKKRKIIIIGSLIILAVVIVGLIVICSYYNQKKQYQNKITAENYKLAYNLESQGNFKGAQEFLQKKIKSFPRNFIYKISLANSYLDEGNQRPLKLKENSQKAREILMKLDSFGYHNDRLYILMGYSYEMVGDFNNALAYYQKALKINPSSADANFHLGHLKWLEGKWNEAMPFYKKAEVNTNADNSIKYRTYLGLGVIYDAYKHNIDKAEEYFNKALPFAVSRNAKSNIYYDLSTLEFDRRNNINASLEYAEKTIKEDPTNDLGYVAYSRAIIRKGALNKKLDPKELKKSKDYLVRAMFINPYRSITRYEDGQWEFLVGHKKMALSEYGEALKIIEKDNSLDAKNKNLMKSDIYFAKSIVYLSDKNIIEAKQNMKQAFSFNPVKTMFLIDEMKLDKKALIK